jgi:DNA invertase Pin-like site-specific DNA recombinase
VAIVERINAIDALVKVLDRPPLDLTTPLGRDFVAFLSAMAEDKRQRIVKRASAGGAAACGRGARLFGRSPALSVEQQADARRRLQAGERSLGRIYRVSNTTIARLSPSG